MELYNKCFDLYKNIIKTTEDDYEEERKTNLSAVVSQLVVSSGYQMDFLELEENTYELTYNKACALIELKSFVEAEQKLRLSEKLCRETLEEDGMPEDDINNELAIIR